MYAPAAMSSEYVATDLHGHTWYSDGRCWPEELVRARAAAGIRVVAVSDHDTFAGVRRAERAAASLGVVIVPAMETTSFIHFGTADAEQLHVLAYFAPGTAFETTALHARAHAVYARWQAFALEWMDTLPAGARHAIDHAGELPEMSVTEFPALTRFNARLRDRCPPLLDSFRDHHARFWTDSPALFSWQPEELIDAIRADGGLDIVAHPNRVRDKARMERVLRYASGLEVYTSRHNPAVAARFRAFAVDHGKHWTASSDDHQNAAYCRPESGTPLRTVQRILGPILAGTLTARPTYQPAPSA